MTGMDDDEIGREAGGPDGGGNSRTDGAAASEIDEEFELLASLKDLSQLVTRPGQEGLEDLLTHIATFAVRAIPGADGAGLTLLEAGHADTIVATAAFVREVDEIQYRLGEGPCISAAAEARTVTSGSLGGDQLWPRFGPRVGRLGVHSVLSLPLIGADGVLGAMNVYAHGKDVFDERAVHLGELFAVPAAISVQNAQALFQARRLVAQLQTALTSRAVIDQALGILMSRSGASAEEAFMKLRVMSQTENRKLSTVAQVIRDEAVRRARARHVGD